MSKEVENKVLVFIKREFEKFKRLLKKEKISELAAEDNELGAEDNYNAREGTLNIVMQFLKKINRNDLADRLEKCKKSIKR